jgi:acetyltransferase-like isoleucine patch superfamily enzyme
MRIARFFYRVRGKPVPYYADYPLRLILWKPVRKWLNVVVIPNIVFTRLRVALYRLIGFRIGRHVFIGMKCYLDDVDPALTTIDDHAVISYGTYFAVHGPGQGHTPIHIKENAYIGMRCTIVSGRHGLTIGRNAAVGAGSLVHRSVPDDAVAVGNPARIIKTRGAEPRHEDRGERRWDNGRSARDGRQQSERSRHWGRILGQESRKELRRDQTVRLDDRLRYQRESPGGAQTQLPLPHDDD